MFLLGSTGLGIELLWFLDQFADSQHPLRGLGGVPGCFGAMRCLLIGLVVPRKLLHQFLVLRF